LTLFLSERQVAGLLDMGEVVSSVEEAFRNEGAGKAVNSPRTKSRAPGAFLNVMHAALPYLGRGGLKCYMVSKKGVRFVVVLFDMNESTPLAVMGADILGRYRTGAASGVATKFMYGRPSATLAIFGSGKQAMTQATAVATVTSVESVRVWSPSKKHREAFASDLAKAGFEAAASGTPKDALAGSDVASTITSSPLPFLDGDLLEQVSHLNVCGGNNPEHSEITAASVGTFDTVAVDDLAQAKIEYGDLIQAAKAGAFSWESAVELKDIVSGKSRPTGKTLFKSGGAALEDVAVASMIYDKAIKAGAYSAYELDLS
jgi:ornithine cyclodeaminase/alanine dehydrogenase-like protein (mu-crystallin family)